MKQYIRSNLGSSDYRYVFRSPILLTNDAQSNSWFEPEFEPYSGYIDDIAEAMRGTDLAEYVRPDLEGIVESITMQPIEVNGGDLLETETKVICNRALSDFELQSLKSYLTGQFSDGWGEGFEQSSIYQYLAEFEDVVWDDEEGEFLDTWTEQVHVYCHVWYYKPSGIQTNYWRIDLIQQPGKYFD